MPEKYVRLVKDTYDDVRPQAMVSIGVKGNITVRVSLHQGSSRSAYLFDMILDVMGRGIKEQPPWCMLFADDIVLCSTRSEHVERKLEKWKTFTYLGSSLAVDGELDAEVTHRVQSEWKNSKRVSGVLCDRNMNVKIKGKVYITVVRPALVYGVRGQRHGR